MSSAQDRTASGTPAAGGPGAHRETASYPEPGYGAPVSYRDDSSMAETGFVILAAALMMLDGLWSFFVGLIAIIKQSFYVSLPNYTFQFSVHGWGWVHLILGALIFAAGACVLLGQTWAKLLGIVLAVFSGLASFLFLPYYPFWSIIVIAMDVFIVWALATSIGHSHRRAA
jgi:hypothetical protein